MLTASQLFPYQAKAVEFQCTHPASALWLDMGLGKTAVTLTSINWLIQCGALKKVLIVAPIRVCRLVWRQEAAKWSHTAGLRFAMMVGDRDQRTRALVQDADIALINYENLEWLTEVLQTYYRNHPFPFDGIVFDEISKCKNSSTNRVKSLLKILPEFKWRTGLTGTPASNGFKDLHGQFLVLDNGARLGESKSQFESRWYKSDGGYKKVPYSDTEERIKELIGDMTLEMSAEDYNPLPDLIINDVTVELTPEQREKYEALENEFFFKLDNGTEVEVFNQASLMNKCLQFSNGFVYPIPGDLYYEPIHDLKLEALADIVEEANGQPILCAYAYKADADRIMRRFAKLRPINLTECHSERSLLDAMRRWRSGDCPLMIGHPACLGEDTQVLTEQNGWISIIDVEQTDRVFDGVEFVSHDGCLYSGHKEVIDLFGITMTPDHKLMIDGEWKEAKDVQDSGEVRKAAIHLGKETAHLGVSGMPELWGRDGDASPERDEVQPRRKTALSEMQIPPHDRNSYLENLAGVDVESTRRTGQKLRRAWDNCLSRMGKFHDVLQRHVANVFRRTDHREGGCESPLLQNKLCVGDQHGAASQQANQSQGGISEGGTPLGRIGQAVGYQQEHADDATQQGNDRGSGCNGRTELKIRKKSASGGHQTPRKAHVYDLVSCGPRHRFLIRNARGEVFISHNSMGHGLDGLQHNGHIVAWYGLNWSLDLVDQFTARIRRQGQGAPVICHRILCDKTMDQAQAMAIEAKAKTQDSLRKAIKDYRVQRGK